MTTSEQTQPTATATAATHALATSDVDLANARKAEREAVRELRNILSAEPWVQALVKVAVARRQIEVVAAVEHEAHQVLNTPASQRRTRATPTVGSIAAWRDGSPSAEFLARPLAEAVDALAGDEISNEITRRLEALHKADAKATRWHRKLEADAAEDPIIALSLRPGAIEVTTATLPDGRIITTHRNISTGQSVSLTEDGKPYTPPAPKPVRMGGPSRFR